MSEYFTNPLILRYHSSGCQYVMKLIYPCQENFHICGPRSEEWEQLRTAHRTFPFDVYFSQGHDF